MNKNGGPWPWRKIAVAVCLALAALYGYALLRPAVALDVEEASMLRAVGRWIPLHYECARWLRLIPFAFTVSWLLVTQRLLRRMSVDSRASWLVITLTAFSPICLFAGTHFVREPLFALLASAGLLAVLNGRAVLAGLACGVACLVHPAGAALIAAGIAMFLAGRLFRYAVIFTVSSMVLLAPAAGWRLAHLPTMAASDAAQMVTKNFEWLVDGLPQIMGVPANLYSASIFVFLLIWATWRRWRLMPDLFVLLYCGALALHAWPPGADLLVVIPLFLWMFWRGLRWSRWPEAATAIVLIVLGAEISRNLYGLWIDRREWQQVERVSEAIRRNSSSNAVAVSNQHMAFTLTTGRRVVPGYRRRDSFHLFYSSGVALVTPDELHATMERAGARFVAVMPEPDRNDFASSVQALERGGLLEALPVPGAAPGYRLLQSPRK